MYHSNDECGLFIIYSVCCLHLPPTVCSIILPPFRLSKPSVSIFNILFSPLHIIWPFLCRHEKTHCFVAGHMNTIHYFTAHTFKIIKNIIKLSGKEKYILYTCISTLSSWTELLSLSTSTRIAATCYRAKTFICMSKVLPNHSTAYNESREWCL